MKKFLKRERIKSLALLCFSLVYCVIFYILYSKNIYKDFFTIVFVPTILVLAEKAINVYLDTSNKPKLMNDAKLFYDSGVITAEEYEEKKQYIQKELENIGYIDKTTDSPNKNRIWKAFIMIGVLAVILSPIIIYILNNLKIIPLKIDDTIVGYCGSILGGALTLIGVIWTINYEKKARKEDIIAQEDQRIDNLAIQYRPILKVKIHDIKNNNDCYKITYINCGRGEAINIRLHTLRDTENYVMLIPAVVDMVPSNKSNTVSLSFTSSFFENNVPYLDFDIEISYKDLYEKYLIKTVVNVIIERKPVVKSISKSICTKKYDDCLKNYSFNIYGNSVNIEKK